MRWLQEDEELEAEIGLALASLASRAAKGTACLRLVTF
jgi:hypothetical protein